MDLEFRRLLADVESVIKQPHACLASLASMDNDLSTPMPSLPPLSPRITDSYPHSLSLSLSLSLSVSVSLSPVPRFARLSLSLTPPPPPRCSIRLRRLACTWYLLACWAPTCSPSSWVAESHTIGSVATRYWTSVYWTVTTMTTTGYGDYHAFTTAERVYAAVVMILGKIMYGFLLGNITSTLVRGYARGVYTNTRVSIVMGRNTLLTRVAYFSGKRGLPESHVQEQDARPGACTSRTVVFAWSLFGRPCHAT